MCIRDRVWIILICSLHISSCVFIKLSTVSRNWKYDLIAYGECDLYDAGALERLEWSLIAQKVLEFPQLYHITKHDDKKQFKQTVELCCNGFFVFSCEFLVGLAIFFTAHSWLSAIFTASGRLAVKCCRPAKSVACVSYMATMPFIGWS